MTKMGPISYIGPKTSRPSRDRPELNPTRNQPSRHRRRISGAAEAGGGRHHENRAWRKATHGRDKRGAPCAIKSREPAETIGQR
ncbi:hypothetical protein F511_46675 [Dorcoceras hygrometricum]|uniref:Uncharacterized protein n=1 Tax=Dorcoceras hygrometricum TaxID=472368 RepID=A0A2Z6ZTZ5_9LAMI|nr:hypothetical protein F511_46675 [Dorcoceras hygrometricum]